MADNEKFKRVNISLDENLASAFDNYAKKTGLPKSYLIKNFIKTDNGKFERTQIEQKGEITSYNFRIQENLYKDIEQIAKEHLISISSVLRLIIAKNILSENQTNIVPFFQEKVKQHLETFNLLNAKVQDFDRTMQLLIKYSQIKSHKGFNFSTIKTFSIKKDIEKISEKLHKVMHETMNIFMLTNVDLNELEKQLTEVSKLISKYEVSIQYFETAIEYYDLQNPFYEKKRKKVNSYQETLLSASIGKFEIAEYLCDLKSTSLITLGFQVAKLIYGQKKESFKVMYLGAASYVCLFYFLIGLSEELSQDSKENFKASFDVYDPTFPECPNLEERVVSLRIKDEIMSISLKDLAIRLGFKLENINFNFIPIEIAGSKGTYHGIHNLIKELIQNGKTYDINLISSTETARNFSKTVAVLKDHYKNTSILGTSHIIFDGEESPKIYQNAQGKRIDNNLFSVALRKFQHYLVEPHMDRFWLPIVMRPDLRLELDDLFNDTENKNTNTMKINSKNMYLETSILENHKLEDPGECMTFGFKKARFLIKKERRAIQKDQMVEYRCSAATTII